MSQEDKEKLKIFSQYIVEIIKPSYLLGSLSTWIPLGVREEIKAEEEKGPTRAARILIDKLLELEESGWYQGFLDVLNITGYTGLYAALQLSDFKSIACLEEPKKLLNIIYSTVKNNINTIEFVKHFSDCLHQREIEEIIQENLNKGSVAGAEKLIHCLLRSDKEEWPKVFTLALERDEYNAILELWDPSKVSKKQSCTEDYDEETSTLTLLQFSEEPQCEYLSANTLPGNCASPDPSNANDNLYCPEPISMVKLRKYQEELAAPAYTRKNTIVCAPTGSGKTLVSLSICKQHLNTIQGRKGKVVFMTTKVPVYEQQKNVFCKYFEDSRYKVIGFCGESADGAPVGLMVEDNDIIILTPQILVNWLDKGDIPSLSIFSMLIFDECHNTTGNHPYNILMFFYLNMKLSTPEVHLPQIIGLTASVGTGRAKSLIEAKNYITRLCASLDIEVISTVKEHKEELEQIVYKPTKYIRLVSQCEQDSFVRIMSIIMKETEKLARDVYTEFDSLSNIQNRSFGTQKYEQWIIDTQKKCRVLQMEDKEEERRICISLFTYTEHLRKYNDAIMIIDDARIKDALDYLENFFTNVKNGSFNDIEHQLHKNFQDKLPELLNISKGNDNPKLEELDFILSEAYRENPETHTLLFVKTRALVWVLKKWIEDTPSLAFLKPEILIGRGKRNEILGMTLPSQKGALEAFKNSKESKMLIVTSVADEGINIQECNLVILYEYVGNVTKMIQVRGRGRAMDSKCFLITSKKEEAEKEQNNLLQEVLMNQAVAALQKVDRDSFLKQVFIIQKEEKILRDMKKLCLRQKPTEGNKKLLCAKCKTFACNTDDIRIIQVSHHTVIDRTFIERIVRKPHPKPKAFQGYKKTFKIFCKRPECEEDWGVIGIYQGFQNIPLIKIEKFVIENPDGTQEYKNKWVNSTFTMKELVTEELSASFSTVN